MIDATAMFAGLLIPHILPEVLSGGNKACSSWRFINTSEPKGKKTHFYVIYNLETPYSASVVLCEEVCCSTPSTYFVHLTLWTWNKSNLVSLHLWPIHSTTTYFYFTLWNSLTLTSKQTPSCFVKWVSASYHHYVGTFISDPQFSLKSSVTILLSIV